jgi:peptidoglycan/xylan/chitin deacetylase (PgdA/CDA1 family)
LKRSLLGAFGVTRRLAKHSGLLLTFDDGPDPDVTPRVLELLAEYHARAVFFIVGNRIDRAPHLLARILDEGHVIGNHSFRHPLDHVPSLIDYYRDIQECQRALETHTGQTPIWFRPPLGSLTLGSLLAPRLVGLRTVLWSVDVGDWKLRRRDEAVQAGHDLANIACPGDIVLLHDDNPCVLTLLDAALPRMRQHLLNVDMPNINLDS